MTEKTERDRIVALETWRDGHQKVHDSNGAERLEKLESRFFLLILGVFAALAGMAGTIVTLVSQ